jgi:photosystem II stability/assembly factor-like uncharacterized protein
MRLGRLVLACIALASGVRVVHAQGADDTPGAIPAGFERVDLSDLTFTLRDDNFTWITVDPNDAKTAYVGTMQGRIYKTTDGGQTWMESTVLTEPGLLWTTSGSSIFFGSIRSSPGQFGVIWDLVGGPQSQLNGSSGSRPNPLYSASVPKGAVINPLVAQDPRYSAYASRYSIAEAQGPDESFLLDSESQLAASGGASFLGVGLSARSPRLSLLTGSRGRPVPVLNRVRLLAERTLRGTEIVNISIDPDDPKMLFAATVNGLYTSRDGGMSWARSFAGMTAKERVMLRIAFRPGSPKLAILGTSSGAYQSADEGTTWAKITTVGDTAIHDVTFDLKDPQYVYMAILGGVLRSTDGGRNYVPIFYSTFPAENDVQTIRLDPFDSETAYIGTNRGAFVTHELHAKLPQWTALEGLQNVLQVPRLEPCPRHRGHWYAVTRIELTTINYGADGPESAIWETWDGGHTWRPIFSGETDGAARSIALDADNPDELWIGWTTALHKLTRVSAAHADAIRTLADVEPAGPPMEELIFATLRYQGLELEDYTERIQKARTMHLWPRGFTIIGRYNYWSEGGKQDDNQFALNRYLEAGNAVAWDIMAYASWDLPDLAYTPDAVPLLRQRINVLNDELRRRLVETIRRAYGELQRMNAVLQTVPLDLKTRVVYRLRIEQLEAVIDLTSGGYLKRWHEHHRRTQ